MFSPNSGKYGPEKLRMRTLCTKCVFMTLRNISDGAFLEKLDTVNYISKTDLSQMLTGSKTCV